MPSAATLDAERLPAESWIGGAMTGITVERGLLRLALADRARVDPDGRRLDRIARAFLEPSVNH